MPDHIIFKWITEEGIKSLVINQYGGETICKVIHFLPIDGYLRLTLTHVHEEYDPDPGGLGID